MTSRVHALSAESGPERATQSVPESAITPPERLMERFVDGDAHAFESLFKQLAPRVASALTRLSGDPRLAEDLTQVAFLRLFRARGAYQRGMPIAPWLFAIARNALLDELRQRRRRPETLCRDGRLPEFGSEPDSQPDPAARAVLQAALQRLPEAQREALVLVKLEGLSLIEAAALGGTSVASIKMRLQRAYRNLRERLNDGQGPGATEDVHSLDLERTPP